MLNTLWTAFGVGVIVTCRLIYMAAFKLSERHYPNWTHNKRRLFAVRVVSLGHATISSILTLSNLLSDFEFVKEPYGHATDSSAYVFLFSLGYFVYDLLDMTLHGEAPQSKEYIVHHSLAISVFSLLLSTRVLFGFVLIGLLVEVQTVTLHSRAIFLLLGQHTSILFSALITTNLVFLLLFRHVPAFFLLYYLLFVDVKVFLPLKLFLTAALSFLAYHNCHLTLSIIKSDGFFGNAAVDLDDENAIDPLGDVRKSNNASGAATALKESTAANNGKVKGA